MVGAKVEAALFILFLLSLATIFVWLARIGCVK